ncbi:hypothetical protein [Variovorax sp. 770b2]|uniref:hypothetical protein n=1 Tax=Variovorax sp. 770b2 TaxID=1566271 RepID=UPI0008EB2D0C|nr:hypothetical protein [Variovorax sp. 770b2]SFQ03858.1 hypothetical protein SAMN03159339_5245 [Variovorax sp. 770b2]
MSDLKPLSADKKKFLSKSNEQQLGLRVPVEKLRGAANRVSAKLGSQILVNGDGNRVSQSQAAWRGAGGIANASNSDILDAAGRLADEDKLEAIFAEQLSQAAGGSRKNLSISNPAKRQEYAAAIRNHPLLRPIVENEIAERIGLTPSQAADELQDLSARAQNEGRPLAFINVTKLDKGNILSAQGVNKGAGHSDAYIALPNGRVLNVVGYDMASNALVRNELMDRKIPYASMNLTTFTDSAVPIHPQAGGETPGCGVLGLSHVKEYLKDGGRQLKQGSLVITGLPGAGRNGDLMFPSPEVLRYSQTSRVGIVADAMMRETADHATVNIGGKVVAVQTLTGMLRAGAKVEFAIGGMVQDMAAAREAWCSGMSTAMAERDRMSVAVKPGQNLNGYLAYMTQRYRR